MRWLKLSLETGVKKGKNYIKPLQALKFKQIFFYIKDIIIFLNNF